VAAIERADAQRGMAKQGEKSEVEVRGMH
jgi:hypothetical protein